jgi:SAM-dependent methyltransferase
MHLLKALFAQISGWFFTILALPLADPPITDLWLIALLQGAFAAGSSMMLKAPPWWMPIHLVFSLLLVAALKLGLAPSWYLGGFLLLALVFWSTFRSRVPLFLTNRATARTLLRLLPRERALRFVDLGCGTGSLLAYLARRRPDCEFVGIENAPLPWLLAAWRARALPNCTVKRGDFWAEPLADYDVVYCFLSPVPMARIGKKAAAELGAEALLISNSFPVPRATPERTVEASRRVRALYLYRRAGLASRDKASNPGTVRPFAGRQPRTSWR